MFGIDTRRSFAAPLAPLALALLLVGCVTTPPSPPPLPPATSPPAATDQLPTPTSQPTSTAHPSPSPTAPATASPTPTSPPSPSPSPTASPTSTATAAPSPAAHHAARLQRTLDRQREAYLIPGLHAAVLFPDGTLWTGSSGLAQLDEGVAVGDDTPFVVGSISKTFVAALVMQLAEEGVLSLDDRLSRWLPDYPDAQSITLRQLLDHSSGVFNYFEHFTYHRRVFGQPSYSWTPREIVTTFQSEPYFSPGTGYHYSNTGYILLGMVIEEATGGTLGDEYRERFFEPLGLSQTFFQGDGPPPSRAAHGYLIGDAGTRLISDGSDYRPTTSAATVAWAAGAVVSSAGDLATWGDALYGGSLLDDESLAEMVDFTSNRYAFGAYGLGTRTRLIEGRRVVGHTGSLRGFAAAMWHFQAEDLTVVVLSNRGRVDVNPIVDRLAAIALESIGYSRP
ncbi:MAG TPA: serine hydrolase domain-containing protein [Candidatus Limnocylindrales bacterium]|nr:serine hydrolase domain-containing protein [Candidatus Limnocylindrales bacterium]